MRSKPKVFESKILEEQYRKAHPEEDLGQFTDPAKEALREIAKGDEKISDTNWNAENTVGKV